MRERARLATVTALAGVLATSSATALEFVRISTIPRGHVQSIEGIPAGDSDHDGRQELYFDEDILPETLNIWEAWGSNSFQPVVTEDVCHPTALGDVDQDGLSDLLCEGRGRAFLLESETPAACPSRPVWQEPLGGFPGIRGYFEDADQDGNQEMWIVPNDPDQVEVWENRGDDSYVPVALLAEPGMNTAMVAFGDFDGDRFTEIVVVGAVNEVFVWENTGDDTYDLVSAFTITDVFNLRVAAARGLDGDGKAEFVIGGTGSFFGHQVSIFEAKGDNTYATAWEIQGNGATIDTLVAVGDVDGDGVEEFVVTIPKVTPIYKAFGDNDFRLVGEVPFRSDQGIQLADLNGNGVDELVFNGPSGLEIQIHELADIQPVVLISRWHAWSYRVPPGSSFSTRLDLFNRTEVVEPEDVWLQLSYIREVGKEAPRGRCSCRPCSAAKRRCRRSRR